MSGLENLLAGKTLVKRYRIEEVIGLGGFAAVYRAADERLGRDVAVKVITLVPPDPDTRERLRERFEREARAAAALPHHPNVVTVHDFGTDPETGVDFLVMELLKGETAAQLFKREGKPATDVALQILRETAEGIGIGHAAGIIHRDVKPGNIFLAEPHDDEPFRVVVLDFGIARIATDDSELTRTLAGEVPLTAAYASPEQIRGEHDLTAAADVFSLGVVGYQLLTGEKPFGAGEGRRLRGRDPVRPVHELNPEVAPALEAVIAKAMADDPAERYPDANAFGAALDEAMAADDRTVIAPAAAPAAAAVAPPDDETVVAPAALGGVAGAGAAAAEASHHPDYVGGPRLGRATAKRGSKAPALVGGLLVLALLAAIAVFAMSRGGGSATKTAHASSARDTATSAGGADTAPSGGPEVLAPPVPGDTTGGAAASTGSASTAATTAPGASPSPAPAAPPIVRTPGIAPASPTPAPSPVHAPVVAPPAPAPAPAPRPSAPAPRPRPTTPSPRPSAPPPSPEPPPQQPQPQPQPAPQSPPPSPPPAPAPPPPPPPSAPSNPPPRDTILIPTPTPATPPPSAGGGTPPRG